jgi:hypothetical protein
MCRIEVVWSKTSEGLVFANLVDFDQVFGHRRDPGGYAAALAEFDEWLGGFLTSCAPEDLLIITADHGNDPTFRGTDHTREQVPLLVRHQGRADDLSLRQTFADVAATLSTFFRLNPPWPTGASLIHSNNERPVRSRNSDDGSASIDANLRARGCTSATANAKKQDPEPRLAGGLARRAPRSRL